jgi:hypothetical protein
LLKECAVADDTLIIRGDDGALYRVSKSQLAAFRIGPDDPAHKLSGKLKDLAEGARAAANKIHVDAICLIAMAEHRARPGDRSASGSGD